MKDKVTCVLVLAVLFFVVANPVAFNLVNDVLGNVLRLRDHRGCPSQEATLVHAVLYGLVVYVCCGHMLK